MPSLSESASVSTQEPLPEPPAVRHRADGEGAARFDVVAPKRQTWAGIARAYATYTSPLRPCREDLEMVERAACDWRRAHPEHPMRVLLLGVTPDIATLAWPPESTLVALDSSRAVITALWPGDVRSRRSAACANWLAMPLRARSCDFVTGDGSLNAFRYPDGWRAAAAAIRHVVADTGVLVIRCYVRPDEPEGPDAVIADLVGPGIADINHFKFRLFLAMQQTTEAGSPVREIHRFLRSRVSEEMLRSMPGWSRAAVDGFELWRNADTVYTFPTLAEVRDVLGQCFRERAVRFPSYVLGNCCPTLLLTRR